MTDPIYLDHNATTPVAPEVFAAMRPWLELHFGNPSSSHVHGRRAAQAVQQARQQVAGLIGAQPQEIVLTGCATEANNLALLGVARGGLEVEQVTVDREGHGAQRHGLAALQTDDVDHASGTSER